MSNPMINLVSDDFLMRIADRHHDSIRNLVAWFRSDHLKDGPAAATSQRFKLLVLELIDSVPESAELTVALRKLLEAKDAAVRATIGVPLNGATTNQ